MNGKIYARYAQGRAKKSPLLADCLRAYVFGGSICVVGEALRQFYGYIGLSADDAGTLTSVTLIFLTALLTGLGVFDKLAKLAGGGTIVPITGFANAITSAAIDNKTEGYVMGVGSKIFQIAGPVIVYGISAGVVYGVIYWASGMF
ncbi:MAG: stage V sporulation protein AC [Clostridia bacterium]|nr:stage V sporulation protein AC [Clostridia bacterium]MBQ8370070.1 stage V sporulation protein AC [Clostridia bacterium]